MMVKYILCIILYLFLFSYDIDNGSTDVVIVAHRGAMADRPENTIVAYQQAVDLGADIIEIDLRMSADGQLFILHDSSLGRTTNGTGIATEYTLEQLQKLDAGSSFGEAWSGERIPSFKSVLQWCANQDVILLLDLKESSVEYNKKITNDVLEYGSVSKVVLGVRSLEQARAFRELLPEAKQLAFMQSPDQIEMYAEAGVDVLRLWLHWLDGEPQLAQRVKETGKRMMINGTTGHPRETQQLMKFTPDWILINDILQLKTSLKNYSVAN